MSKGNRYDIRYDTDTDICLFSTTTIINQTLYTVHGTFEIDSYNDSIYNEPNSTNIHSI